MRRINFSNWTTIAYTYVHKLTDQNQHTDIFINTLLCYNKYSCEGFSYFFFQDFKLNFVLKYFSAKQHQFLFNLKFYGIFYMCLYLLNKI